ncbi:hypothetical protein [Bradyrhizobium elkanii]|uniref:hypothetical protein n=1 Tax=Bradyrhizobium elkanii TaxID=29448 RepID=UPI0008414621|nr:hypothetical protein [Bradyrhizobium elkanii]ODM77809.1 hypothetical protein A6452_34605 [Bradyrhizobium elkanii]ODM81735.1 hypothetical protein A6X20_18910 [Bradyrhizobium elkanii]
MTTFVIDPEGNIVNAIVLEEGADWTPPEGCAIAVGDYAIGGTLVGGVYSPPAPPVTDPLPPPPPPDSCTKLGLKRAFDELGTWASVKAAIAADANVQEEWDLATEIRRADPLVQHMITIVGLSDAQVDQLLIRANALV